MPRGLLISWDSGCHSRRNCQEGHTGGSTAREHSEKRARLRGSIPRREHNQGTNRKEEHRQRSTIRRGALREHAQRLRAEVAPGLSELPGPLPSPGISG